MDLRLTLAQPRTQNFRFHGFGDLSWATLSIKMAIVVIDMVVVVIFTLFLRLRLFDMVSLSDILAPETRP